MMKKIYFLFIIAYFCENSTSDDLTFARIPVGKYGSSQQTCGENTLNGMCFSKRLLCVSILIAMLDHTYHSSNQY